MAYKEKDTKKWSALEQKPKSCVTQIIHGLQEESEEHWDILAFQWYKLSTHKSNRKIQDNLREGLQYPYTEQDGVDNISAMLSANEDETYAFVITADNKVVGSIGVFRRETYTDRLLNQDIMLQKNTGAKVL